jgi:hypothetical protein
MQTLVANSIVGTTPDTTMSSDTVKLGSVTGRDI